MENTIDSDSNSNVTPKVVRAGLNILGGLIPYAGGVLSAFASGWSEAEQDKVNEFLKYRQQLSENEIKEQLKTIHEIMLRLDSLKIDISERIKSNEFQSLVDKCFKNWSDFAGEAKRGYIRNILINAATTSIAEGDVIRLFIDWIKMYSDFHFNVIACIYHHQNGISRGDIWQILGKKSAREDSSDADLYKLLIRDLSTGGIIRQFRQTDYYGRFITEPRQKNVKSNSNTMESAFDTAKLYVLTELGKQFVHYAITETTIKISGDDVID